ncbi:polyprotein [Phytophthora palmivora]|uniref:Polyprotein n=1 Tax=Phytophthora palmivora TaxID=4796 RepID=A0A2P4X8V2_9STRA|nr:polyprotein [Phytophthora palmivora]
MKDANASSPSSPGAERNYPVQGTTCNEVCSFWPKVMIYTDYACHQLDAFVAANGELVKLNVLVDALSRRPVYELANDRIRLAYQKDENYTPMVRLLSESKTPKSIGFRLDSGHSFIAVS